MITNGALIGVIAALAIIGCIHTLECLAWFVAKIICAQSPKLASRVTIGTGAGFNLQLGTSVWYAWNNMTKKAKRNYTPAHKIPSQFSGMMLITFVSVVCVSLLIMLEVGVVYISQPVTQYVHLHESGLPVFKTGSTGRLEHKVNGVTHLEVRESSFQDSISKRLVSTAYVNALVFNRQLSTRLELATQERARNFSVTTVCTVDGKNQDGSDIDGTTKLRIKSNEMRFFFFDVNIPFAVFTADRTIETLEKSQTFLFTDFTEAEGEIMETQLFNDLDLSCDMLSNDVFNVSRVKQYKCDALKEVDTIINYTGTAVSNIVDASRLEMARRIFRVDKYTIERESVHATSGFVPGKVVDGITAAVTGIDPHGLSFMLLCIAAVFGIMRLFSGAFVDHRELVEMILFKAPAGGEFQTSRDFWNRHEDFEWRVYNSYDTNCFGYTNQKWSDDFDTPFAGENNGEIDLDPI